MAELKTKQNDQDVTAFLKAEDDPQKRTDCFTLVQLMEETTHEPPRMWGNSIVGFGSYHYRYASGREGDWFLTGFSPRKQNLTIYIMSGFSHFPELMEQLGKYKISKSCLYVKKLDDLDQEVLKKLVAQSVHHVAKMYG